MKVKELIDILQVQSPDRDLTLVLSEPNKKYYVELNEEIKAWIVVQQKKEKGV